MRQPKSFTVQGERTEKIDLTISHIQLRFALYQAIYGIIGDFDDAGCDWFTDDGGNTYVGYRDWHVSSDPNVATLVDAAAIIAFGKPLKLEGMPA